MDDSPHKYNDKTLDNYTCLSIQKYLVVFGCILISLTIGSVYTFGNILPYFTSYIAYSNRTNTSDIESIYNEYHYQTSTIYCVLMIFQSISMSFGNTSKVYLVFGFQRSCLLGCFIVSFGIGLTYFTCHSLFLSCLTYGIMVGIGCGIVYPSLIICCMSWWPNKKQLMAAIISCSYGLGPMIFNMVQSYFINPTNIKQNTHFGYMKQEHLMYHFPDVFVLIALIFSLMQIIGILCLRNPTAELDPNTPYIYNTATYGPETGGSLYISPIHLGRNATSNDSTQNAENGSFSMHNDLYYNYNNYNQYNRNINTYKLMMDNNTDYTLTECFYLWEFWKLFIITMLNVIICLFIVVLYQDFSFNYLGINNPLYLAIVGSVSSIFHALFRLLYSSLYEYGNNSFQKSNGTASVILTCFVATLSLCQYKPSPLIFFYCIVLFSCLGSIYTFIPKCIVTTFGITNCTELSSIIILSEIPASIIFAAISTNLNNSINAYNTVLILLCVFGIISVMLTLSFSPQNVPKKKSKKVPNNENNNEAASNNYNGSNDMTIHQNKPDGFWDTYETCIPPYLAVIGGLLIMMTIGTTFCFGNIKPYIASYLASKACHGSECHNNTEMKHLYQTYSHRTNWIFCTAVIFEAIASVIGGKLEMYLGAEYCALLGSSIMSLGCALTHFTINNIFGVIVTYGIFFGFGAGIAYPCVVVCVMKWWPRHVGVATGFIYAGFGFGAFIFDLVQTLYINPGNVRDDPDLGFLHDHNILDKVPQMFLFIASVFMTMQILGVILLSSNTPYFRNRGGYRDQTFSEYNNTYRNMSVQSSKIYGNSTSFDSNISTGVNNMMAQTQVIQQNDNIQAIYDVSTHNYRPSEAFCTFKFWQLFVISTLNIVVFLFITSEWKVFMFHYLGINNDHFASFVGSISALCNGIFRILWGIYYDFNKSFAISMGTMTICLTIFTGTLSLCSHSPNIMIVWWYAILFSCIGGSYSFYPKVVASTFGYTYSGIIIGCLLLAQIPAAFTFILITNFIENMVDSSWVKITIVVAILSFISAVLSITYRTPSDDCYSERTKGNNNDINNILYDPNKRYHTTEFTGSKDEREFGDFDEEFMFDANGMDNETVCTDVFTNSMGSNLSKKSLRSSLSHNMNID